MIKESWIRTAPWQEKAAWKSLKSLRNLKKILNLNSKRTFTSCIKLKTGIPYLPFLLERFICAFLRKLVRIDRPCKKAVLSVNCFKKTDTWKFWPILKVTRFNLGNNEMSTLYYCKIHTSQLGRGTFLRCRVTDPKVLGFSQIPLVLTRVIRGKPIRRSYPKKT